MDQNFWEGKRVFITGHTGFKGAWLALVLKRLGAQVFGYSNGIPTVPSLFQSIDLESDLDASIEGDVRDLGCLTNAVRETSPDIVFHLAAQSQVRPSYQEPIETFSTNIMGTVNLLEASRQVSSVKVVVNITTDKVYEEKKLERGYGETDALGSADPYSSSKACSEIVTAAYRNSFFEDRPEQTKNRPPIVASARAGNVIGGGDWASDRLFTDLFTAFSNQETVTIRNPNATRPWQHVLDALNGYLLLAENLYYNRVDQGAWNFGPYIEDSKPVTYIVELVAKILDYQPGWNIDEDCKISEAQSLILDTSKARSKLGWTTLLALDEAVSWVVDWWQAYLSKADVKLKTIEQIDAYRLMMEKVSHRE